MIPALELFWAGLPKWARDGLVMAAVLVVGLILGKAFIEAWKAEGAAKQRAKDRERQAEVKIAVTTRQAEVLREESRNADEAIAARDGPLYPTADSVPDALKGVTFRPQGSGRGS